MATFPAQVQFPVEIIGSDLDGQQFFEQAQTLTIHRNGASILLNNKLAPDSEVIVRSPETNTEATASVLGEIRKEGNAEVYGVIFLVSSPGLWDGPFPDDGLPRAVRMECSSCHTVSIMSLA